MDLKKIKKLNESYHRNDKIQRRIISPKNFTYRSLIEILPRYLGKSLKIVDFGCGVGTMDFYLASLGNYVIGIDSSQRAISVAKLNSKVLGKEKNTRFFVGNFPEDKFDGKHDMVIMTEIIEHLSNDRKAFEVAHKVLKKNGVLIVSTRSINAPLHKIGLTRQHDKNVGHLRRYTAEALKGIALDAKFEILEVRKSEGLFHDFLFSYPILGSQIVRVANKFDFFSDFLFFIDNIFLKLLGEAQIHLIAKK